MITSSIRRSPRPLRLVVRVFALLVLATLAACSTRLTPTVAQVSGRSVELVEAGAGAVTVVFESGLGDDWEPWDDVASEVALRTRVFAYSRPGYGDSDATSSPRDAAGIVEELRALLAARAVAPPYVLVGHSFGGAYMELFAKAHPEEVVGLVLVDSRHRDFTTACEAARIGGCSIPASAVASLPQVEIDEFQAFARSSGEIHAAGAFGAYPVRVLTATSHSESDAFEALWKSLHGSLAHEAAHGEQRVFNGAGHYLQIEEPEEVTQTILRLLPPPRP